MISTGINGSGGRSANFFSANMWSGSASNLAASVSPSSSRGFYHSKLIKSGSEESLNNVQLLQDEKNIKNGSPLQKVKRNEKLIRKRCRSQNDFDTVDEHVFIVSAECVSNNNTCSLPNNENGVSGDEEEEEGDGKDSSITETSKSKCDAPVKVTKRLADLKKNERSKQKELLASILDDTDDIDQLEYFDDNEIYSSSSPSTSACSSPSASPAVNVNKSPSVDQQVEGKQTKSTENVAFELLRALSIKSSNMWWRWSKGGSTSKDSSIEIENPTTPTGSDLLELEMNSIKANGQFPPSSSNKSENTIISKLKNFAKMSEEKEKMDKFTFYTDEPDQKPMMLFKGCSEIYKVKSSEETLRSIAARYKTTPAEIKVLFFINTKNPANFLLRV